VTSTDTSVGVADGVWWKDTWLLDAARTKRLAVAFAAVVTTGIAVGVVLYRIDPTNAITRLDDRVAVWSVDQRTAGRTTLASWGAFLADTPVKIAISTMFGIFALWRWRRWRETLLVATSLIFEASAYVVISFVVGRERPDVERLVESPVDTTFPSGHVAAATMYGAFVVILFWHVRSSIVRALGVSACALVVASVALARMYEGMHYLTDVLAGAVLGVVSLVVCVSIIGAPDDAVDGRAVPTVSRSR